jgi:DNA-binding IclR family transcriptional regulator
MDRTCRAAGDFFVDSVVARPLSSSRSKTPFHRLKFMARSATVPRALALEPRERRPRRAYTIRVLERALLVLSAFSHSRPELRLADFAHLGLHKSTLYRLLEVLRAHRLVEHDPVTGQYRLGLRLFELGMLAVGRLELARSAQRSLDMLVERTGETAHLGVLDGADVVSIGRAESPHALRMPGAVGRRTPAHGTAIGKVLLAHVAETEQKSLLAGTTFKALTRRTLVRPDQILRELRAVRQRGYAIDDEEVYPGVRCVGAPVHDHTGTVVAAVSAAGPTTRLPREHFPRLAAEVLRAAEEISKRLGFTGADTHAAKRRKSTKKEDS